MEIKGLIVTKTVEDDSGGIILFVKYTNGIPSDVTLRKRFKELGYDLQMYGYGVQSGQYIKVRRIENVVK